MLNLIIKDIKNILYDRKTLAMILLMPIVLMSILGVALQGAFNSNEEGSGIQLIEVGIVKAYDPSFERAKFEGFLESGFMEDVEMDIDLDEINPEKIFFEDFLGSDDVKKILHYRIIDPNEGEQLLYENKIAAMIVLPQNFVYDTYVNMVSPFRNKVTIEVVKNSEYQFSSDMIEIMITGFSDVMNNMVAKKMVMIDTFIAEGLDLDNMDNMDDTLSSSDDRDIHIEIKEVTGEKGLSSFQYYAVAIMTMFLLYAAGIGGKALIEEKNDFTLQRLEVAGKSIAIIAISNFFRIMMIGVLQSIVMIIYSRMVISVVWGDVPTVIIGMVSSAFAVGGLGALVSVITLVTDKYYIANIFEFGIVNLMALVGGSFIPVEILPKALQKINFIAINGNAINIYLNAMKFRPIHENNPYIVTLLSMGIIFLVSAFIVLGTRKRRVII